jgi:hypothetical protein
MPIKNPHPLYDVWRSMKDRCFNQNFRQWDDYGGRGITVCDRWKNSFQTFVSDMGERPLGHVIDRINNDGNYEPSNCRWVDRKTSQRNRRCTQYLFIEGEKYLLADLAARSGLKADTIKERAALGISLKEVLDPAKRPFLTGLAFGGKANGLRQKNKTHCPHGHSYEDAYISPEGWRSCATCRRNKQRDMTKRKRENSAIASG